jgi:cytochrome c oxidase subunit 3
MKQLTTFIKHHVAHHFDNAEQEFDAAKLGMWVFLIQELMFFGGLFVAYFIFRGLYPAMFVEAHHHLSWQLGALNTVFLITSSFTMVMAVRSAQVSNKRQMLWFLLATFLFAGGFMCVKYIEYMAKIHHGFLPARWFFGEGTFETLPIFFGLYFTMTGLHGLHVLIGMGLIAWMMIRGNRGEFHAEYYTPLEMVGLYWHLVDLIWIFLFPLLYLVG